MKRNVMLGCLAAVTLILSSCQAGEEKEGGSASQESSASHQNVSLSQESSTSRESSASQESSSSQQACPSQNSPEPTEPVSGSQNTSAETLPVGTREIPGENSIHSDVFTRYLCRADLWAWPTEDLWLLRNTVYAAHGRKFSSDVLNEYFSRQSWYRGNIEPEDFSESVLSEVEKGNIAFIQELEKEPFSERNKLDDDTLHGLESLPPAPYLSYLGVYKETGLYADLTTAKDMGAYYKVQGTISFPASITQEQFDAVSAGEKLRVVLNELTGESQILERNPNAASSDLSYDYFLYKEGSVPSEDGVDTHLFKDNNTKTWLLHQTSEDTVMKIVYSGDIYILKGAVQGADVGIGGASKRQYEIIPPGDGGNKDENGSDVVTANCLRYNEKGHFTAVYYLGD